MAIKSLRIFFLALLVMAFAATARTQVVIIPEIQAGGVMIKEQLWSAVINNLTGAAQNAVLYVTVTDRASSQVLLEANSNVILLKPGVKRVSYNELAPLNYAVTSIGFSSDRQFNQPMPVGEYLVCYRVFNNDGKKELLASECIKVVAEPLSPPLLIQPENKTVVMEPRPVMTWTPPAPVYMFNALSYDIIVSPLYDKQSPEEALQRNIPVMTTSSANNSILYPSTYTNLETGKTYAWQVVAKDAGRQGAKSEVWTFTVMPDSVVKIIENAIYVKLVNQQPEVTVVHQGIVKIGYYNFLSDTLVRCSIRPVSGAGRGKQTVEMELPVRSGQNFIEYNINGKIRLNENTVYELKLVNGRREEWTMRFIPKRYF